MAASDRMTPVESSFITAVGYDPDDPHGNLRVAMASGKTYLYQGVARHVWEEFLAAESKGKFFNSRVKGRYPEREVP